MSLFDRSYIEILSEEAMEFIRKNADGKNVAVSFSGGKDSIVTLDLVRKSGIKYVAIFCFTTIEIPENIAFIKQHYPEVKWLMPSHNFYYYVAKYGLPHPSKRWCCRIFKETPGFKFCKENNIEIGIEGVRAEESWKRANRGRVSKYKGITRLYPIFHWSTSDVWEYIQKNNLPVPEYYKYFSRNGCIPCPLRSPRLNLEYVKRYPRYFLRLKDAFEKYSNGRFVFEESFKRTYKLDFNQVSGGFYENFT